MKNIRFKIDVISPNGSKAAKDALVASVQTVLGRKEFESLKGVFKFLPEDVIMRNADPLRRSAGLATETVF